MTITFKGAGAPVSRQAATGDTLTLPIPAGVTATDVLIAVFAGVRTSGPTSNVIASPPSGWTSLNAQNAYWALGNVASSTFTLWAGVLVLGFIVAYSGVNTVTPLDVAVGVNGDGSGTVAAVTTPSITTITANDVVVCIFQWETGDLLRTPIIPTYTEGPGLTHRQSGGATNGVGSCELLDVADFVQAAPGATGTRSITTSTIGDSELGIAVALQPIAHWGVDSLKLANKGPVDGYDTLYAAVVGSTGRTPEFWGRYIGKTGTLTKEEVSFLHKQNCRVLLIYRDTAITTPIPNGLNAFNVTTYPNGVDHANQAIQSILANQLLVPAGKPVWIYADIEFGNGLPNPTPDFIRGWSDTMAGSVYGGAGGIYGNTLQSGFYTPYCTAYNQDPTMQASGAPAVLWTNQPNQCDGSLCPPQALASNPQFTPTIPPCTPLVPSVVIYQYATNFTIATQTKAVDFDVANDQGFATMWAPPTWEAYPIFDDDTVWNRYETFTLDSQSFFLSLFADHLEIKCDGGVYQSFNYDGVNHSFVCGNASDPNAQVTVNGTDANHVTVTYAWTDASGPHTDSHSTGRGTGDQGVAIDSPGMTRFMDEMADGRIVCVAVAQRNNSYPSRDFAKDPADTVMYSFISADQGATWTRKDTLDLTTNGFLFSGGKYGGIVAWGGSIMAFFAGSGGRILRVNFNPDATAGSQWSSPVTIYTAASGTAPFGVWPGRSRDRTTAGLMFVTGPVMFFFLDASGNVSGPVETVANIASVPMYALAFNESNQPVVTWRTGDPYSPYTDFGPSQYAGNGHVYEMVRGTGGWPASPTQIESQLPLTVPEQFALLTPGDTGTTRLPVVYGGGSRMQNTDWHSLIGPYVLVGTNQEYVLQAPQTGGTRYPIAPVFIWHRQTDGVWSDDTVDFSTLGHKIALGAEVKTYKSHEMPFFITDSGYVCGAVWMARDGVDPAAHYTIWFLRRGAR